MLSTRLKHKFAFAFKLREMSWNLQLMQNEIMFKEARTLSPWPEFQVRLLKSMLRSFSAWKNLPFWMLLFARNYQFINISKLHTSSCILSLFCNFIVCFLNIIKKEKESSVLFFGARTRVTDNLITVKSIWIAAKTHLESRHPLNHLHENTVGKKFSPAVMPEK